MNYYQILETLHKVIQPNVYVEVGIASGVSFLLSNKCTFRVGIDPYHSMKPPYPENALLVKKTSDYFFKSGQCTELFKHQKIDFAFIDGMHLFEYALRDFINIEKHSHKKTVIAIHDCVAKDTLTASRERSTKFWTGDVWKLVLILKKYRADVHLTVLDSTPTGLVLVTNLDPNSQVLNENYDTMLNEFMDMPFTQKTKFQTENSKSFDFKFHYSQRT